MVTKATLQPPVVTPASTSTVGQIDGAKKIKEAIDVGVNGVKGAIDRFKKIGPDLAEEFVATLCSQAFGQKCEDLAKFIHGAFRASETAKQLAKKD